MKSIRNKKLCIGLVLVILFTTMSGCRKVVSATEPETVPVIIETARQLNENLQTILIMVTDTYDISGASGSYRNGNRADFLLLLFVDDAAGKVRTLQLNPNAVIPFSLPGLSEDVEIPLGQVYSYGSGGSDSYLNICKAISQVMDGVPVNHYLSFTMDAIGIVSDVLEGVPLAGAEETIILQGTDAVSFFAAREEEDISNEAHMKRQQQFMLGMYQPFMTSAQNDDFLTTLTLQLGERMATDMTLSQMLPMFETLSAYEMEDDVLTISGKAEVAEGEFRFYMDQTSLDGTLNMLVTQ